MPTDAALPPADPSTADDDPGAPLPIRGTVIGDHAAAVREAQARLGSSAIDAFRALIEIGASVPALKIRLADAETERDGAKAECQGLRAILMESAAASTTGAAAQQAMSSDMRMLLTCVTAIAATVSQSHAAMNATMATLTDLILALHEHLSARAVLGAYADALPPGALAFPPPDESAPSAR
jgi:hypothetical protein